MLTSMKYNAADKKRVPLVTRARVLKLLAH